MFTAKYVNRQMKRFHKLGVMIDSLPPSPPIPDDENQLLIRDAREEGFDSGRKSSTDDSQ
jgi:hypothetical protein